jgi:hypothetical protein
MLSISGAMEWSTQARPQIDVVYVVETLQVVWIFVAFQTAMAVHVLVAMVHQIVAWNLINVPNVVVTGCLVLVVMG